MLPPRPPAKSSHETSAKSNADPSPLHSGACCACAFHCTSVHLARIQYLESLCHEVGIASKTLLAQNEELRSFNSAMKAVLADTIESESANRAMIETLERRVQDQMDLIRELTHHMDASAAKDCDEAQVQPHAAAGAIAEMDVQYQYMSSGDQPPKCD